MHGSWHFDALLIFMGLSVLITMLIRTIWRRVVKWFRHVIWMKRRAHGTLISDNEAAYWLKLIDRPDYNPNWRWSRAREWERHIPTADAGKTRTKRAMRFLTKVNVVLGIAVIVVFVMSIAAGNIKIVPDFPTTTKLTVDTYENATFAYTSLDKYVYRASETPSQFIVFGMTLKRTDSALVVRDVHLTVTSGSLIRTVDGVERQVFYVTNVYAIFVIDPIQVPNENGNFDLTITMRGGGTTTFILVLEVINYDNINEELMATIESTGGDYKVLLYTPRFAVPQLPR